MKTVASTRPNGTGSERHKQALANIDTYEALLAYKNMFASKFVRDAKHRGCVNGVAIGVKETAGKLTDRLSIIVYVNKKVPRGRLTAGVCIPSALRVTTPSGSEIELLTDVQEANFAAVGAEHGGDYGAKASERVRPCPGGVCIGPREGYSGTLGCWVKDKTTNSPVLLGSASMFHTIGDGRDPVVGEPVYQPAPQSLTTVNPDDQIGELLRWTDFTSQEHCYANAAVCVPSKGIFTHHITGINDVTGNPITVPTTTREVSHADYLCWARISGAGSGVKDGVIKAINATLLIKMELLVWGVLEDQILVQSPDTTDPYNILDVGSAVLSEKNELIGLLSGFNFELIQTPSPHWQTDFGTAVVCPIRYVFGALGLEVLPKRKGDDHD